MSDFNPIMLTATILTLVILGVGAICFPLWYVLHKLLSKRLDPILLKEPYFTPAEQLNYQFFPLYLVKAINYIYLVAWPSMARRRRFKGLDTSLPVGSSLRAACIAQFSLMVLGTLTGIAWFSFLIIINLLT